jgi:hypothetical protein
MVFFMLFGTCINGDLIFGVRVLLNVAYAQVWVPVFDFSIAFVRDLRLCNKKARVDVWYVIDSI